MQLRFASSPQLFFGGKQALDKSSHNAQAVNNCMQPLRAPKADQRYAQNRSRKTQPRRRSSRAPNNFPETPDSSKNGKVFAAETNVPTAEPTPDAAPQAQSHSALAASEPAHRPADLPPASVPISFHETAAAGKEIRPRPGVPASAGVGPAWCESVKKRQSRDPRPRLRFRNRQA